ncbi:GSCFA domain-containing protein [Hartmannibacter diazotrophicus]|nr:GSCFA domain-containing protein [Hartmannibacter diazotrophicus]
MRIGIVGNCQVHGYAQCFEAMSGEVQAFPAQLGLNSLKSIDSCDLILVQTEFFERLISRRDLFFNKLRHKVRQIPTLYFPGFHPDITYAETEGRFIQSPMSDYNSSIILYGWINGFSAKKIEALFNHSVFERLGFYDYYDQSIERLREDSGPCNINLDTLLPAWKKHGIFFHSINHPKIYVLSSIASEILRSNGVRIDCDQPEDFLYDNLAENASWPLYPEIGYRLGVKGSYAYKLPAPSDGIGKVVRFLNLPEFIEASLESYSSLDPAKVDIHRFRHKRENYIGIEDIRPTSDAPANPYLRLPASSFWRKGVERCRYDEVDPVVHPKFSIARQDQIATSGSCFAQHIAKRLVDENYNFLVTETAPITLDRAEANRRHFGLFSARYGNIYTARQLLQLIDRAYGRFKPVDRAWMRRDGRFIDPFRPQIEPDGYLTEDDVAKDRERHLACVRDMFEECDLFVFTLGLTEGWMSSADGSMLPVAPGTIATKANGSGYHFVNFSTDQISTDLHSVVRRLKALNPNIRILFTVSPVPLVATYEDSHVLTSTVYSKSSLRAAANDVCSNYDFVDYFPSYEIITGPHARGTYFEQDLRSVTPEGVAHVMRVFAAHYLGRNASKPLDMVVNESANSAELRQGATILCDEELLDQR